MDFTKNKHMEYSGHGIKYLNSKYSKIAQKTKKEVLVKNRK